MVAKAPSGPHLYDVAVVGTGPTGLAAALALSQLGADVAMIGPTPASGAAGHDTRTAALLISSIDLLKALGAWTALAARAAPLKAIRIADASRSLFRAPDVTFEAREIGLEAFGYNIPNTVLVDALYARAQAALALVLPANVEEIAFGDGRAVLSLSEGGSLAARLVVGADGRQSICRRSAGIEVSEWHYDQRAIATSFSHARPHEGVSTELHREAGSITTVPMPDPTTSSLIWVETPPEINGLMERDAERFAGAVQEAIGDILGSVSETGPRATFPVIGLRAKTLAARRIALLGEAAHVLPPIGAQGLNLGLRDVAALADCVAMALRRGDDPGGTGVLDAYADSRRLDVLTRTVGIDLMSRSMLTGFLPLQMARGAVLHGLNALGPLRRLAMRAGLAPPTELPSLMRPPAA